MKRFFPLRCHSVIFHLYQYFFWRVAATMRRFPWLRIQEDPLPTAKLLASQIVKLSTSKILATPWNADSVFICFLDFSRASCWKPIPIPQAYCCLFCLFSRSMALLSIPGLRAPNSTWQSQIWTWSEVCCNENLMITAFSISNYFIFTKAQVWWAMLPLCWHVNARKQRIERCRFLLSMWLTAVRSIPKKEQKKEWERAFQVWSVSCVSCVSCVSWKSPQERLNWSSLRFAWLTEAHILKDCLQNLRDKIRQVRLGRLLSQNVSRAVNGFKSRSSSVQVRSMSGLPLRPGRTGCIPWFAQKSQKKQMKQTVEVLHLLKMSSAALFQCLGLGGNWTGIVPQKEWCFHPKTMWTRWPANGPSSGSSMHTSIWHLTMFWNCSRKGWLVTQAQLIFLWSWVMPVMRLVTVPW